MRENFHNRNWMTLLSLTSDDGDSENESDNEKKKGKENKESEKVNGEDVKPQERSSLTTEQT